MGDHRAASEGPDHEFVLVAAVVIGRNEGDRLRQCLESIRGKFERIIYVDSGSDDDSVRIAQLSGCEVLILDAAQRFTAARARNAGLDALRGGPRPRYVQFVDGDCVVMPTWVKVAISFLETQPDVAVACGRRRERFPSRSVYNRLCDREWDTPIGPAKACGGDALVRMSALDSVGGFDPDLIAGEEPELCVRLRKKGWRVWRLDADMTLHDANMMSFNQWWRRMRRSGYAAAEGAARHGRAPEWLGVSIVRSTLTWAVVLPILVLIALALLGPAALLGLVVYPAQVTRIASRDGGSRNAWEYASFIMLGKVPQLIGVAEYCGRRLVRRPARIIEYK